MWEYMKTRLVYHRRHAAIPEGLDPNSNEYKNFVKDIPWQVLWLDNHNSHIFDPDVLMDILYHRVLVLSYPPHTTHINQMLDSGINTAIKVEYINGQIHAILL